MTELKRSPYTGRPVDEWLDEEIELHDADGDKIGKVVEINPDFVVAWTNTGFLGLGEPRMYFIPRDQIIREDEGEWSVAIDKDEIESKEWNEAPAESAWSEEWRDRQSAEAAEGRQATGGYESTEGYRETEGHRDTEGYQEGRQGTRIRRYEEELEATAVPRSSGEVVIEKNVVEEKRQIEVPVRREEVNIERRPVTGEHRGDADDAFAGESIRVPVMEEEVEVRKVPRAVEEIEVTKSSVEDTRHVEGTVRREEIDVDDTTRENNR